MPMKFGTSGGGGDFTRVPAGSHLAICNMVVDLGMQPGSGMYPAPKHQVFVRFEVPEERVSYEKDGKKLEGPIVIGKTYTASMNEKANLRKDLESWRGVEFTDDEAANFDVSSILGKGCMLSVVEAKKGDKIYSNIKSISGLPKGLKAGQAENNLLYYAGDDVACYEALPEWIRKKIDGRIKETQDSSYREPEDEVTYDDIPF